MGWHRVEGPCSCRSCDLLTVDTDAAAVLEQRPTIASTGLTFATPILTRYQASRRRRMIRSTPSPPLRWGWLATGPPRERNATRRGRGPPDSDGGPSRALPPNAQLYRSQHAARCPRSPPKFSTTAAVSTRHRIACERTAIPCEAAAVAEVSSGAGTLPLISAAIAWALRIENAARRDSEAPYRGGQGRKQAIRPDTLGIDPRTSRHPVGNGRRLRHSWVMNTIWCPRSGPQSAS